MGSIEDESQSPVKDCHHRDGERDDGKHLGGADTLAGPELSPTNTSRCQASQEDGQPEVQKVNRQKEELENSKVAVDGTRSVDDVVVDSTAGDLAAVIRVVADQRTEDPATRSKVIVAPQSATASPHLSPHRVTREEPRGGSMDQTTGEEAPEQGGERAGAAEIGPIPRSPAPPGQQHMRTQVSLEVVQCHSVACSPMTPPGGDNTFVFPDGAQAHGGKVQTGRRVEVCSVATAPMTPRTPVAWTFPDTTKGESAQAEGGATTGESGQKVGQNDRPEPSSTQLVSSQVAAEAPRSPCRPQTHRMGSMDQDITILVTQHDNAAQEEDHHADAEGSVGTAAGTKMGKIEEDEDCGARGEPGKEPVKSQASVANSHAEKEREMQRAANKSMADFQQSKMQIEGPSIIFREKDHPIQNKNQSKSATGGTDKGACLSESLPQEATKEADSLKGPPVPGSPAPSGCSHMRTQVSLEVVQCQSAATSPMTPPEGDNAFIFPPSTRPQVEYRSIATAPMTPNTPVAPVGFPVRGVTGFQAEEMLEADQGKGKGKGDPRATEADVAGEGVSAMENGALEEGGIDILMGGAGGMDGTTRGGEKVNDTTANKVKLACMTGSEGRVDGTAGSEGRVDSRTGSEGRVDGKTGSEERVDGTTGNDGRVDGKTGSEERVDGNTGSEGRVDGSTGSEGRVDGKTGSDERVDGTTGSEGKVDGKTGSEGKVDGTTGGEGKVGGEEGGETNCKDGGEEVVQEVSWDEKGMTWEVYGAVVEVAVLGTAIQKHLEKQVKKQKQPSLPPPPPLNPSAVPLPSPTTTGASSTTTTITAATHATPADPTQVSAGKGRSGKRGECGAREGRRRRNPFRLLLRNMQQPRCCSRAHSAE